MKCIQCEINKQKGYLFTLLAKLFHNESQEQKCASRKDESQPRFSIKKLILPLLSRLTSFLICGSILHRFYFIASSLLLLPLPIINLYYRFFLKRSCFGLHLTLRLTDLERKRNEKIVIIKKSNYKIKGRKRVNY